jgi:hypothetical protein
VLIAGGFLACSYLAIDTAPFSEEVPLDTAELYDPAAGTFTSTGKMNQPRPSGATSVLLLDGRVLIVGGGAKPFAEIYNPATGAFTISGSENEVSELSSSILLPDGNVLVSNGGGGSAEPKITEVYDVVSGTFHLVTDITPFHVLGTSTLLPDGRVLIAGDGIYGPNGEPAGGAFSYDVLFGAPVGNGSSSDLFASANSSFTSGPTMTTPRAGQSASLLANGQVLLAGGAGVSGPPDDLGSGGKPLASAELYDPVQHKFIATGSMVSSRMGAPSVALYNGKILIAGGYGDRSPFTGARQAGAEAELYTPPSMPVVKIVSPINYSAALLGPFPHHLYADRTQGELAQPLRRWQAPEIVAAFPIRMDSRYYRSPSDFSEGLQLQQPTDRYRCDYSGRRALVRRCGNFFVEGHAPYLFACRC